MLRSVQFMLLVENNPTNTNLHAAQKQQLVKLMNDLLHNMEHKSETALVCINLSATFKTVHHEMLLELLHPLQLLGLT